MSEDLVRGGKIEIRRPRMRNSNIQNLNSFMKLITTLINLIYIRHFFLRNCYLVLVVGIRLLALLVAVTDRDDDLARIPS